MTIFYLINDAVVVEVWKTDGVTKIFELPRPARAQRKQRQYQSFGFSKYTVLIEKHDTRPLSAIKKCDHSRS